MRVWIRGLGFVECVIGFGTIFAVIYSHLMGASEKSVGVVVFVLMAAVVSSGIGVGLLLFREAARQWTIYFSGYIVLEKLMIFLGMLSLNGKVIPDVLGVPVDWVSLVYHLFLLFFLSRRPVRIFFKE